MPRKASEQMSEVRKRQRRHAKGRFQERFQLEMNRDRLHEIERKIVDHDAVAADSAHGKNNYLVEVQGALVLVGYDHVTHRVVTVLPEERLRKLPPELITLARALLLPTDQARVISEIRGGNARLLNELHPVRYYELTYEGVTIRVAYDSRTNELCKYKKKRRKKKSGVTGPQPASSAAPPLEVLNLPTETAEEFERQLRSGVGRFLWRRSNTVTFHQVILNGEPRRVGYSATRRAFIEYQEPPETKPELQSSVRLLSGPQAVIESIEEQVRTGKAELCGLNTDKASYRAECEGDVYYFAYDVRAGRIEPWNRGR